MRATILASILGVLGFTTYSMPRSTHEVIFERIEVPVVVKEYIIVTRQPHEIDGAVKLGRGKENAHSLPLTTQTNR